MSNQIYVIAADPETETRHPVYADKQLPEQGAMVLYTPFVARRILDKTLLRVMVHKETGAPMFDMENPAHRAAYEAYAVKVGKAAVNMAKFAVEQTEADIEKLQQEGEALQAKHEELAEKLETQREELTRLESEHGESDDDTGAGGGNEENDDLQAAFALAVERLETDNPDHWTNDKAPDVRAINQVFEDMHGAGELEELHKLTAADRDTLWDQHNKGE